jgi:hypothetical protein
VGKDDRVGVYCLMNVGCGLLREFPLDGAALNKRVSEYCKSMSE